MSTATATDDGDAGTLVVNCEHLMKYVDANREEGNAAYKAGRHSDALAAWQRGLDALAQAEGKPMRQVDVVTVQRAVVTLHSNRGQALLTMQFWRRGAAELSEALKIDAANAKARWRRYKCYKALKEWPEAEADLDALLAMEEGTEGAQQLSEAALSRAKLEEERAAIQAQRAEEARIAEETLDDRMEDAAHKSIEAMRLRFEEVTRRNGLHGNTELATELADMITRPGGVSVSHIANTYQIDDDDADILMQWAMKACEIRDTIGYQSMDAI